MRAYAAGFSPCRPTAVRARPAHLVRGNLGRQWMAIRDMDIAAELIGIRPLGFGEGFHDQVPDTSHPPTNEPVVAGRIRPKALRQIAPWCA